MVIKHGWNKKNAAKVNCLTNQRKHSKDLTNQRIKCRVPGCPSFVISLRDHYRNMHPHLLSDFKNLTESQETNENHPEREIPQVEENVIDNLILDMINSSNVEIMTASRVGYDLPLWGKSVISKFRQWMQGPQGGSNQCVTVEHNYEMISRVFSMINVQTLDDLMDDSKLWVMFIAKKTSGDWADHTARSYMNTLKKFMLFVTKDKKNNFSTPKHRSIAGDIILDLPNWPKSYKNPLGIKNAKKGPLRPYILLDAEKINKYKASTEYKDSVKHLEMCEKADFTYTPDAFTLVRNYLLFNIILRNANKTSILAEMSVKDFHARIIVHDTEDERTNSVITIIDHKTLVTSAPANLILSPQMDLHMRLFEKHFRSRVASQLTDKFFTTSEGTPLGPSSA